MATAMHTRARLLSILLLAAVGAPGCSTLNLNPNLAMDPGASAPSDPQAMVVVELRHGNDKNEYLRAPLTQTMLVQDALKGSGAISRFRRMDIVLVRQTPDGNKIRLPIKYDVAKRHVVDANNYAMHAGDWLEVTEDRTTAVERMFASALEPLRPMMRKPGRD